MNKNNKKGFTLVELMAVIIILIIIIFITVGIINKSVDKSENKAMVANAGMYIKGVTDFVSVESITNTNYKDNVFTISDLDEAGVKISGTKPDDGYVHIKDREVNKACLKYGKYYVKYENGKVLDPKKGNCPDLSVKYEFDYSGEEVEFKVPFNGVYRLEVWGAQGGDAAGRRGGYGAYSSGNIYLHKNDKLYINVGGKGEDSPTSTYLFHKGGYNGGGDSRSDGATAFAAGGGATSIATTSGLLSSISPSDLLIAAAGGGGGGTYAGSNNTGGNGGGISGNRGDGSCGGYGATQTAGGAGCGGTARAGSFGQGANFGDCNSGGGGGYYGGGTGFNNGSGGGGGSSYIANNDLFSKEMFCYNCTQNTRSSTLTTSVSCVNSAAKEKCAKMENGYATITFVSSTVSNAYPDHLHVYYDNGVERENFYTASDITSASPEFYRDKIVLGTGYYTIFYTDLIDLSLYNSVIIKRTNVTAKDRIYFQQNPQIANGGGEGFNFTNLTVTELGNDYYVADISEQTRTDLHFAMNQYNSAGSGTVYFIAFSTQTASEIAADHSYLP